MNLMMDHRNNTCGRCGHPKNAFQTIKFADLFTHLHPNEGHSRECQCDEGGRHDANLSNSHSNVDHHNPPVKMEPSCVPVIQQHHTQYLSHGSHPQQQPQLHHHHQHSAFSNSAFNSEMDQHHHQTQEENKQQQQPQQHLFGNNYDTHPNNNYVISCPTSTGTTYLTTALPPGQRSSHPNGGGGIISTINSMNINNKAPILLQIQQDQQPKVSVGVITKNQSKEIVTPKPPPPPTIPSIPPSPRVPCSLCKKTFVNEKMATAHMQRVHEKISRFVCEICGASFSYRGSLDSHLCSHNTTPIITFDCPTCGQKFKQKTNLAQHMKGHLDLPKRFPCPHCPTGFSKRVNLRTHMKRKHPDKEEEEATTTTIPSSSNSKLSEVRPASADLPSTISSSLSSSSSSKKNKKEKSQGQGNFKCDECGRSFLFKNNLKAHQRVHSKEKKYTCAECEKSFIYKESLKNHMLLHSNEMPYKCDICHKQFRDRSNRRKHVKNVHKYLFLNNNNGESGLNEGLIGNNGNTQDLNNKTQKINKNGNSSSNNTAPPQPQPESQPVSNVIKKARKRVKKVPATPAPEVSEINLLPPPTTGAATASVIVSHMASNAGVETLDRKIIMSPGPRPTIMVLPNYAPPPPESQNAGTNVIVKTPVQMQNVIVYHKQSRPDIISSNGASLQNFPINELQSSSGGVLPPPPPHNTQIEMESVDGELSNGHGGFQHFTLSRGIITASSAVTNNVHYNYEPQQQQQQQQPQFQQWNDQTVAPQSTTPTLSLSHHDNNAINYMEQTSQYGSNSSNIIYASSSNNHAHQHNNGGDGTNGMENEHLDLLSSQNGSAFFYKDLSQFDFSYL